MLLFFSFLKQVNKEINLCMFVILLKIGLTYNRRSLGVSKICLCVIRNNRIRFQHLCTVFNSSLTVQAVYPVTYCNVIICGQLYLFFIFPTIVLLSFLLLRVCGAFQTQIRLTEADRKETDQASLTYGPRGP